MMKYFFLVSLFFTLSKSLAISDDFCVKFWKLSFEEQIARVREPIKALHTKYISAINSKAYLDNVMRDCPTCPSIGTTIDLSGQRFIVKELIGHGSEGAVLRVQSDSHSYALKVYKNRALLEQNEVSMQRMIAAGHRAPKRVAVDRERSWVLSEYIPGLQIVELQHLQNIPEKIWLFQAYHHYLTNKAMNSALDINILYNFENGLFYLVDPT